MITAFFAISCCFATAIAGEVLPAPETARPTREKPRNPLADPVAELNRQIEQFNAARRPDMGPFPIRQRVARMRYDSKDGTVICMDQQGEVFLTLKREADGRFRGDLDFSLPKEAKFPPSEPEPAALQPGHVLSDNELGYRHPAIRWVYRTGEEQDWLLEAVPVIDRIHIKDILPGDGCILVWGGAPGCIQGTSTRHVATLDLATGRAGCGHANGTKASDMGLDFDGRQWLGTFAGLAWMIPDLAREIYVAPESGDSPTRLLAMALGDSFGASLYGLLFTDGTLVVASFDGYIVCIDVNVLMKSLRRPPGKAPAGRPEDRETPETAVPPQTGLGHDKMDSPAGRGEPTAAPMASPDRFGLIESPVLRNEFARLLADAVAAITKTGGKAPGDWDKPAILLPRVIEECNQRPSYRPLHVTPEQERRFAEGKFDTQAPLSRTAKENRDVLKNMQMEIPWYFPYLIAQFDAGNLHGARLELVGRLLVRAAWPSKADLRRFHGAKGMTKEDVRRLLGAPRTIEGKEGGKELWYYPWVAVAYIAFDEDIAYYTYYDAGF